jgi:prephenate dehydrogenase
MQIAVIGIGLIGGSIAAGARSRLGAFVSGFDLDPGSLELALERGLIDRACGSVPEAVSDAETVFLAVPVGDLRESLLAALKAAPADCVVTDTGSTKRALAASVNDPRFVGGHPLAGTEHAGTSFARADLFDGAAWYLTPSARTGPDRLERVCGLISRLGAQPTLVSAEGHDRLMASVSHLPHVLANALVCEAARVVRADAEEPFAAGPSFRDLTRVAGAPSAIWTDIYMQNADLLAAAIERTIESLREFHSALAAGDAARVTALGEAAAAARLELHGGPR